MKWKYLWRTFDEEGNTADKENEEISEVNETNEVESMYRRGKKGTMFVIILDLFMLDNITIKTISWVDLVVECVERQKASRGNRVIRGTWHVCMWRGSTFCLV